MRIHHFILGLLLIILSFEGFSQINFSHDAGYHDSAFELLMEAEGEIVYTLDCSNPLTSRNSFTVASKEAIMIDPTSINGRDKTPAVVVRAAVKKDGFFTSEPVTKTFIFLDEVKRQRSPQGSWPTASREGLNDHFLDYNMDTRVTNGADGQKLEEAFSSIETISLTTEIGGLFDRDTGIYVNSFEKGIEWERACSFEIIGKDNTQKVQANAGIRLKGGWSRQIFNPKYSFRVVFKSEYGPAKLEYPVFGEDAAQIFNKINLYTAQNMSWSIERSAAGHHTFLRDVFSRDFEAEMGKPHMRSEYVHLFLNGMYWGLYMTQENGDAAFGEEYFGGKEADYDAIKVNEIKDGNDDIWKELWEITNEGYISNRNYFKIQGKDPNGNPQPGSKVLVDLDNLIDYMLLVFYTGNFDGPVIKFISNDLPNNFYALNDRTDNSKGFIFMANDFEYSMMVEPIYGTGIGIEENRVNIGDLEGDLKMECWEYWQFNPQWLHHRLTRNREYRTRFMDRAFELMTRNGALTNDACVNRIELREAQIETAIIAESARWGDTHHSPAMGKSNWEQEVNVMKSVFCKERTEIVLDQLVAASLYHNTPPPSYEVSDVLIEENVYHLNGKEKVEIIGNSTRLVYFTFDGTDPRAIGEGVNPTAFEIAPGENYVFETDKTHIIKARVKLGTRWSPLRELKILAKPTQASFANFKVTELAYHPEGEIVGTDTIGGKDFEFIEFRNIGPDALNISGIRIDSAVGFVVPDNTILAAGDYFVVADKPARFFDRYGLEPSGNFTGNFSNSSEFVLVEDSDGNEILSFTYFDEAPWPEEADGDGPSLTSVEVNPTGDPNNVVYWRNSNFIHGSPFFEEGNFSSTDSEISLLNYNIYPNPTNGTLNVEGIRKASRLSLTDISGRNIFNKSADEDLVLDLKVYNLTTGLYFLSIEKDGIRSLHKVVLR